MTSQELRYATDRKKTVTFFSPFFSSFCCSFFLPLWEFLKTSIKIGEKSLAESNHLLFIRIENIFRTAQTRNLFVYKYCCIETSWMIHCDGFSKSNGISFFTKIIKKPKFVNNAGALWNILVFMSNKKSFRRTRIDDIKVNDKKLESQVSFVSSFFYGWNLNLISYADSTIVYKNVNRANNTALGVTEWTIRFVNFRYLHSHFRIIYQIGGSYSGKSFKQSDFQGFLFWKTEMF